MGADAETCSAAKPRFLQFTLDVRERCQLFIEHKSLQPCSSPGNGLFWVTCLLTYEKSRKEITVRGYNQQPSPCAQSRKRPDWPWTDSARAIYVNALPIKIARPELLAFRTVSSILKAQSQSNVCLCILGIRRVSQ